MIREEAFQQYGRLVAAAAEEDAGSAAWEDVAHALLALMERQDEAMDQIRERVEELEAERGGKVDPTRVRRFASHDAAAPVP